DYVLFLDDDDLIHPRLIEDGIATLQQLPSSDVLVFQYENLVAPALLSNRSRLELGLRRIGIVGLSDDTNSPTREILEQRPGSAFLRFLIPIHSCLVRRAAIDRLGFPPELPQ